MPPGLLLVWCGTEPCFHALSLADGVMLGRELLATFGLDHRDEKISRRHVAIEYRDGAFQVADQGSRNGTSVGGRRETVATARHGRVIRAGRTLAIVVDEIAPYQSTTLEVIDDLVVGPRMAPFVSRIRELARAGTNVAIVGVNGSGRTELAKLYARTRGRPFEVFDTFAEKRLSSIDSSIETLVFREISRLPIAERETFAQMLARPGFTLACSAQLPPGHQQSPNPPPELVEKMRCTEIEIPCVAERFDEVPTVLHRVVARVAPEVAVHPTAVEAALFYGFPGWADLIYATERCVKRVVAQGLAVLYGDALDGTMRENHTLISTSTPRRRRRPGDDRSN